MVYGLVLYWVCFVRGLGIYIKLLQTLYKYFFLLHQSYAEGDDDGLKNDEERGHQRKPGARPDVRLDRRGHGQVQRQENENRRGPAQLHPPGTRPPDERGPTHCGGTVDARHVTSAVPMRKVRWTPSPQPTESSHDGGEKSCNPAFDSSTGRHVSGSPSSWSQACPAPAPP